MVRKKALLAGAMAGARGPAVTLDGGIWEIEVHPHVSVRYPADAKVKHLPDRLRFVGRVRVTTAVSKKYAGKPIHLNAVQVA